MQICLKQEALLLLQKGLYCRGRTGTGALRGCSIVGLVSELQVAATVIRRICRHTRLRGCGKAATLVYALQEGTEYIGIVVVLSMSPPNLLLQIDR